MPAYLRARLSVQMFLCGAINGAWQPVLPPYLKQLGLGEFGIALCLATVPVATMISPLLAGQAADRWVASERLVSLLSLACGVLMFAARPIVSFAPFVGAFFAAMLVTAPLIPMSTSLSLQNLPDGARDFPLVRACMTLGHVSGANLLSLWLWLTHGSFRDCLLVAGSLALVNAVYSLTLPNTPPKRDATGRSAIGKAAGMLRDPGTALLFALLFCVQLFGTSYYARGPLFLLDSGVSREGLSSLMSVGQMTEIVVVLLLPFVFARWGPKATIAVGIGAWATRYACWSLGGSYATLVAAVALHGVCFGCARIAATIYVDRICPRDARASAQSLMSLAVDGSGNFLGNFLIGAVVSHFTAGGVVQWRSVWMVPAVGCAAVLAVFLAAFRARRGPVEVPEPLRT
ncbi:MAG TPA: MFS transporter [Planctomycetota bacterium]|nr:MFS transporter [Planctomycetota bacterium]